jgi:hypothetical protein
MTGGRKYKTRAQLLAEIEALRQEFEARESLGNIGRSDALPYPRSPARFSGSIQP